MFYIKSKHCDDNNNVFKACTNESNILLLYNDVVFVFYLKNNGNNLYFFLSPWKPYVNRLEIRKVQNLCKKVKNEGDEKLSYSEGTAMYRAFVSD